MLKGVRRIINENLIIRTPELRDIDDLLKVKNNRKAARTLAGENSGYSKIDIENWISYHNNKVSNHICVIDYNGLVIGHVGLYDLNFITYSGEFGILIGLPSYWGLGIGYLVTQEYLRIGFNELGLSCITLDVLKDNFKAIALYEKLGFEISQGKRAVVLKEGSKKKVVRMDLLKSNFEDD
jgi:RimJ/RimL family protein N-acetyltransferase